MRGLLWIVALIAAPPTLAQDREFCADRPGLDTPPCTIAPGRVMVELGLADWTMDRTASTRSDTIVAGDTRVRVGIADRAEVQVAWTAFGHVRTRDRVGGSVDTASGVGDVGIGLLRNLRNPDGSGTSIALLPFVTLPVGGSAIGAGDWGAGIQVPLSFDIGKSVTLMLTPEVDAAVDQDRSGRHLAYGSVGGLTFALSDAVFASAELQIIRDRDPDGRTTQALGGVSVGWRPGADIQWDVGTNLGLNHDTPDVRLYAGVSRRF